jgi:diguanylate cyclase (GGDEF)-like protein
MAVNRTDIVYPIIILISIMMIIWQHFGMNKSYQIYPSLNNPPIILNDKISGGRSTSSIEFIDGVLNFKCNTLNSDYTFAFCGVVLPIKPSDKEYDFSGYTQLDIWLELEGDDTDTVLLYLRNSETSENSNQILRSNQRALLPKPGMQHYALKLNEFSVPSWWLFANQNAKGNGETNFTRVTDLFITTGDNTHERSETLKIKHAVLKGKWLSAEKTYFIILVTWGVLFSTHLFFSLLKLSNKLTSFRLKAENLESMNELLSIENNKFESMAKSDPLTKVLNRAGIRDVLDQVVIQLEKNKTACSIIMLDIDHFKAVNDQYGHDIGDQLLINLVNYIQKNIREQDSLVRWGGEEFVLVCQNTPLKEAVIMAEKLCLGIAETTSLTPQITCSFGVSEIQLGAVSTYFKKADVALYQAKKQGRNRVISSELN